MKSQRIGIIVICWIGLLFSALSGPALASSSGVAWKAFYGGDNALLTAKAVRSFLSSDEVSETLLLTASCVRNSGLVYLTNSYAPRSVSTVSQTAELSIWTEVYPPIQVSGQLDTIATSNAGDGRIRYGFNLPVSSNFFQALGLERIRHFPQIDLVSGGRGVPLQIFGQSRQELSEFLQFCGGGQVDAQQQVQAFQPGLAGCRNTLLGANPWIGDGKPGSYDPQLVEQLCGPNPGTDQPAICFQYIMAGKVDWDNSSNWNSVWVPQNAANLCTRTGNWEATINCFQQQIFAGNSWGIALDQCRAR